MTDFHAMKGKPVTLTDEQASELIALDDGELLYSLGMCASMSKEAAERVRAAAMKYRPVRAK